MSDYVYTTVPGKISRLLQKIREIGIPPKAHQQWLKIIGFTSSNDTGLLGVLKQVGLIDPSGIPTPVWNQYRGADYKVVLGKAIRIGYADLFAVYPDADRRTALDLEHVFSTSSSAGKQVIGKTVSTFKLLCENATFSDGSDELPETVMTTPSVHTPVQNQEAVKLLGTTSAVPSIHIDIQVHIAPESSPDQIDQIFKSMSKHLYGKGDM